MRGPFAAACALLLCCGDGGGQVRQWGALARGSAGPSEGLRGAAQAAGAPDALVCGDSPLAWEAPPFSASWLEIEFAQEVSARSVTVSQTYLPGFVSRIEIRGATGDWRTVLEQPPVEDPICPSALIAAVDPPAPAREVRLWIDTQASDAAPQIDAVELAGDPLTP